MRTSSVVSMIVVVALVCLAATTLVEAKKHKLPANHPQYTADLDTLAHWARIKASYEARNYTRTPRKATGGRRPFPFANVSSPYDGVYGVDVSSAQGIGTWQCLVGSGYTFAIVRAWTEDCSMDPNGAQTVANAWAGGVSDVDIYLFPSYGCGTSAAAQVDATIDGMGSVPFGTLWFDIETGGQGAPSDNDAWMQQAVVQAVARIGGNRIGVYSSAYEWSQVMGSAADLYSFPLWYPDYDGVPNFNSFSGFAGWTSPAMKQFQGDASVCGADVDLSWYP